MDKFFFQWHFTFSLPGSSLSEVTIEETHPDLSYLKSHPSLVLTNANLIDLRKFSLFDDEDRQLESIVASAEIGCGKLIRVFRRVEVNIGRQVKRTIPAFQYRLLDGVTDMYCFAFPTGAVLTPDSRFSRREW